jgi:hypothetical protein
MAAGLRARGPECEGVWHCKDRHTNRDREHGRADLTRRSAPAPCGGGGTSDAAPLMSHRFAARSPKSPTTTTQNQRRRPAPTQTADPSPRSQEWSPVGQLFVGYRVDFSAARLPLTAATAAASIFLR